MQWAVTMPPKRKSRGTAGTSALMFAGMKSLCEGNKSRATQHFQASITLNPKKTGDYRLARAELKFLGH